VFSSDSAVIVVSDEQNALFAQPFISGSYPSSAAQDISTGSYLPRDICADAQDVLSTGFGICKIIRWLNAHRLTVSYTFSLIKVVFLIILALIKDVWLAEQAYSINAIVWWIHKLATFPQFMITQSLK
jgi:hypothetical protein